MTYRQVLDSQVKSKVNYPIPIPLEPHLDNRYAENVDSNSNLIFIFCLWII